MMQFLQEMKKWLGEITEILLLLIAVAIAAEILFGAPVSFFGGVAIVFGTAIALGNFF